MINGSCHSCAAIISYPMRLTKLDPPRLIAVRRALHPGDCNVKMDTSQNEGRKALLSPARAAALKMMGWGMQLHIESVTFLDQQAEPSIGQIGGLKLNQLWRIFSIS